MSETSLAHDDLVYVSSLGLHRAPFATEVPLEDLYVWPELGRRLELLLQLAEFSERPLLVTGLPGSGKTALLRLLLQRARPHWRPCLFAGDPQARADTLLAAFHRCLTEISDPCAEDLPQQLQAMHLLGQRPLLIVDQAHLLSASAIQGLCRVLTDCSGDGPAFTLLLCGAPPLRATVEALALGGDQDPLHLPMPALDSEAALGFLQHRLSRAGLARGNPLLDRNLREVTLRTVGTPARLLEEADRRLQDLYGRLRKRVQPTERGGRGWLALALGTGLLALLAGTALIFQDSINALFQEPIAVDVSPSVEAPTAPAQAADDASGESLSEAEAPDLPGAQSPPVPSAAAPVSPVVAEAPTTPVGAPADAPLAAQPPVRPAASAVPATPAVSTRVESVPKGPGVQAPVAETVPTPPPAKVAPPTPPKVSEAGAPEAEKRRTQAPVEPMTQAIPTRPPAPTRAAPVPSAPEVKAPVPKVVTNKAPRLKPDTTPVIRGEDWLRRRPPGRWTLQVLAGRERASLERFVARHKLAGQTAIFRGLRKGGAWYSLLYGDFASRAAAVKRLPALSKRLSVEPWPRTYRSVQRSMGKP